MGQTCIRIQPGEKICPPRVVGLPSSGNGNATLDDDIWIQYVDLNSGVPYFHNVRTKETSWEQPTQHFLVHPSVIDFIHPETPDGASVAQRMSRHRSRKGSRKEPRGRKKGSVSTSVLSG
mmetsp:Transcript_31368/g.76522  ORF Transcript_31368/g.76522 Transcript_31368/m.76522 type:complete len:120 (-) Transcript_31368:370-729(-)|eukprot:CAMPEP_0114522264 /NCGR_PEP_ID=MMETSP0109-20121206/20650_1 /TAXON_ID=29199 /ORGANISM="Chlorarachnion reptans, Strain CCCM449" /LENGTH=119 /DNA_ID=CAMNT_0001703471 /DNA_START=216 /DNA_END=575 /DNA_ORIENTATION=+